MLIKNVEALRARRVPIGYQNGSFVAKYLQREFGIAQKTLRTYTTPEEAGEALSKGPNNGGVAAIFDEIPYIRIFLTSQCGYTMGGPIYKTGGFGFVFLRALLWSPIFPRLLTNTVCTDSGTEVDSGRLSIGSFWALYLITGTASLITLTVLFILVLHDYMRDPNVKAMLVSRPELCSWSVHLVFVELDSGIGKSHFSQVIKVFGMGALMVQGYVGMARVLVSPAYPLITLPLAPPMRLSCLGMEAPISPLLIDSPRGVCWLPICWTRKSGVSNVNLRIEYIAGTVM